jgi:hypothetical protein
MSVDVAAIAAAMASEFRNRAPNMPVDVMLHEAKKLGDNTRADAEKILALPGFKAEQLNNLEAYIEYLAQKERAWAFLRDGKAFASVRNEAEAFRKEFVASASYLLRGDDSAQQEIERIKAGSGLEDLSTDMGDIAVLAEKPAVAVRLAIEPRLPADIGAHARDLGKRLVKSKDSADALEAQAQRNLAFWLLADAVDEVRAGAKYLHRDDPMKLDSLSSQYEARRKRQSRAKARAAATVTPNPVEGETA